MQILAQNSHLSITHQTFHAGQCDCLPRSAADIQISSSSSSIETRGCCVHASRNAQPILDLFAQAADPILNPHLQLHSETGMCFPCACPALVPVAPKIASHVAQKSYSASCPHPG